MYLECWQYILNSVLPSNALEQVNTVEGKQQQTIMSILTPRVDYQTTADFLHRVGSACMKT